LKIPFEPVLFSLFQRGVYTRGVLKKPEQKDRQWNIHSREPSQMSYPGSINELSFPTLADAGPSAQSSEIERLVMQLYERFRDPLLRYALSLDLSVHDAEEVVQEVFLSLFRHLQLRRSRSNLRGWLFRVAHNLGLKQLYANQRSDAKAASNAALEKEHTDPSPNPEEELSMAQRRHRLLAVVHALPQTDQCCLALRAEGLGYREISAVLGMSLGAVSISLTRSLARLSRADRR
jgi:RNA polymerase sigma-70 factor, ECF subfamily